MSGCGRAQGGVRADIVVSVIATPQTNAADARRYRRRPPPNIGSSICRNARPPARAPRSRENCPSIDRRRRRRVAGAGRRPGRRPMARRPMPLIRRPRRGVVAVPTKARRLASPQTDRQTEHRSDRRARRVIGEMRWWRQGRGTPRDRKFAPHTEHLSLTPPTEDYCV